MHTIGRSHSLNLVSHCPTGLGLTITHTSVQTIEYAYAVIWHTKDRIKSLEWTWAHSPRHSRCIVRLQSAIHNNTSELTTRSSTSICRANNNRNEAKVSANKKSSETRSLCLAICSRWAAALKSNWMHSWLCCTYWTRLVLCSTGLTNSIASIASHRAQFDHLSLWAIAAVPTCTLTQSRHWAWCSPPLTVTMQGYITARS